MNTFSSLYAETFGAGSAAATVRATAIGVRRNEANETWELALDNGSTVHAQVVILTLGNMPPANPFPFPPPSARTYFQDPWMEGVTSGVPNESTVFIIGTGLTMLDLVLALRSEGHGGTIHALSRRGLLPHSHRPYSSRVLSPPRDSPCRLLHWLRAEIEKAARDGYDWRSVIDAMRPHTRHIWQAWTIAQRRSFLRHARAYWDSHRHRCAPTIDSQIQTLIDQGTLLIHRGRIRAMREKAEGIDVRWSGPTGKVENVFAARVINCTGPASNYDRIEVPLIRDLRRAGWLVPDPLGLGIQTDMEGRVLGRDGRIVPNLYAMGPLRRPAWWESVAIPEIREQAQTLAEQIANPSTPNQNASGVYGWT